MLGQMFWTSFHEDSAIKGQLWFLAVTLLIARNPEMKETPGKRDGKHKRVLEWSVEKKKWMDIVLFLAGINLIFFSVAAVFWI